jgi:hypothetical protein
VACASDTRRARVARARGTGGAASAASGNATEHMTEAQARTTANIVLGVAIAGAAFYILRTPQLRRAAFQLAGAALTGTVPAWLSAEVKRAWAESSRHGPLDAPAA